MKDWLKAQPPPAGIALSCRTLDEVERSELQARWTLFMVAVAIEYADAEELRQALAALQPSLAACLFTGGLRDQAASHLVDLLSAKVGRIAVDNRPTGVAFSWAQHHGGPWPSTSDSATTSVGAAGLARFVRPVAYQATPDEWLPAAAQDDNPWSVQRRVNGLQVTTDV